ncbi:MAG: cysteine desulfurase NifS [Deltaproteobacteria bacterium]|jgi:cysteine desulfurase|nr:cysteine desulfurase NifS [Deltaproteobacteria bacterium]
METIYFDNNATTRVDPQVLEAMLPFFKASYGNPSSMHHKGGEVGSALRQARLSLAALLGCEPHEIVYTSCGTESDNTALWSALRTQPDKRHVVTSKVEHSAIINNATFLAKQGYRVTEIGVDRLGRLDMDQLKDALTPDTAIVSLLWANNETGVLFPILEAGELCRERGVVFHTDAVQAVGKIPIDLRNSKIDMLSLSGHKLEAPKGIGALYVRHGLRFAPFMIGGHQENGRRGGTENVPYIVGLGAAADLALKRLPEENGRVRAMRDRLEAGLLEIPSTMVNGDREFRLPNTTNISFEYVEGESILFHLSHAGLCASSGSACTSGSLEPSHVLRAMGVPFTAAHGSIRLSLSVNNTDSEVDRALEIFPAVIMKLRDLSPFWKDGAPALDNALLTCDDGNCQICS